MKSEDNHDLQSFQKTDEGGISMPETAMRLQADERDFIHGMTAYIKKLKALAPEEAQKDAKEALIRTGVLTKDGKIKKSIVSWE